jgi:hypothetical protein
MRLMVPGQIGIIMPAHVRLGKIHPRLEETLSGLGIVVVKKAVQDPYWVRK